jgi:DNA-binding NarL/FixJ family response regulator
MIRVLISDDQPLVRGGVQMILSGAEDIEVVGESGDGERTIRLARQLHPDLILMDIRMPGLDGIESTRRITADESLSDVKILILTTFDADEYVFEALRAGASGFVLKEIDPAELCQAIRTIAGGEALLAPSITRRLIAEFAAQPRPLHATPDQLQLLTGREREVTALVAMGLSNDEIASRLVVSLATARTHVSRALGKLGARDRAQLVVIAYEIGLVRAPRP